MMHVVKIPSSSRTRKRIKLGLTVVLVSCLTPGTVAQDTKVAEQFKEMLNTVAMLLESKLYRAAGKIPAVELGPRTSILLATILG